MNAKIKLLRAQLRKEYLDGLLLSSPNNISYLTGCLSRDAYFILTAQKTIYLTDFRYTAEAKNALKNTAVEQINGDPFKKISAICQNLRLKCLGFEERYLSFAEYRKLRKELPDSLGLAPLGGLVESLRQIKTNQEIKKIKKAVQISIKAFNFIQDYLKPGIKEIEAAGELERFIRYHNASDSSFNIIVASGPNSAFAHHITSERKLKANEPVLIDLGAEYCGYKSDLTRVFFLGKMSIRVREIYRIVRQAQEQALRSVQPEKTCAEIDGAARSFIENKGYGGFFGHGLGHGVGLEIHEEPHIEKKQKQILQPGMVFTVEPAIYLPGKFGIRLEDMVLVTKKGNEVLSGALNK